MNIFNINNNGQELQPFQQSIKLQNDENIKSQIENTNTLKIFTGSNINNGSNGLLLNNSDSELISSHLEKYLNTDSLRLEIQIERSINNIGNTKKQMDSLSILSQTPEILAQKNTLEKKYQREQEILDQYKTNYRNISPIHSFALWVKDLSIKPNKLADKMKNLLYGNKAQYLNQLKTANDSMQKLIYQIESIKNSPQNENMQLHTANILNKYEEIQQDIEKANKNYNDKQSPSFLSRLQKFFQKTYYGYELPQSIDEKRIT